MPRTTFTAGFGRCAIAWSERGVTDFWLPEATVNDCDEAAPAAIAEIIRRVRRHFCGDLQDFSDLPFEFALLAPFDASVLQATLRVPPGSTRSYGDIAAAIGQPPAVSRAVGRALGANRWPLLVPCHRIVSASGKMTGFSGPGGIATKLRLLALEGAQLFAE